VRVRPPDLLNCRQNAGETARAKIDVRSSNAGPFCAKSWHPAERSNTVRTHRLRLLVPSAAALSLALPIGGCARRDEPAPAPAPSHSVVVMPPEPQVPTIVWKDPPKWTRVTAGSAMRKASYQIAAAAGDPEDAEATVYYFGPANGGSTEANIQRWTAQFPDVAPGDIKKSEREANGMKQTILDLQGTYDASSMLREAAGKKPNFRMIAAIVETPAGNYFFKLVGPQKTVESAKSAYFALLDSVNKG
jgi:hypothetical protein